MMRPADLSRLATELGGLPILGCLAGSPAERAGIRYGDIVLSINGEQTASWADFFAARRRTTGQITVRVFRLGTEFEVSMELPETSKTPREVLEELQSRDLLPHAEDEELAFSGSRTAIRSS
jgi:S1-C subfamily serine protease